jgi:hypothetical protein
LGALSISRQQSIIWALPLLHGMLGFRGGPGLYALAVPPAFHAFCGVRPIAIRLPALQALMRSWTQEAFI